MCLVTKNMSSVILEISKFLYQFFLTYFTILVQLSLNECVHVCGYFLITKVISNMSVFYAPLYCWWLSHIKYGFCIFQLLLKSPCSLILWNPLCCRPIDAKLKKKKKTLISAGPNHVECYSDPGYKHLQNVKRFFF